MYGKTRTGIGLQPIVDSEGVLLTKPMGGSLADAALEGRLFCCATQTAINMSTTLNTTFVGWALTNPTGSGKLVIVHEFAYGVTAKVTAETLLALATTTDSGMTTAEFAPRCCRNAYATSVCTVRDGGSIVAPVIERIIGQIVSGTDDVSYGGMVPNIVPLDGSIVLAPGRALVTDSTVAPGAVMQFSYMWEEVDE